MKENEKNERRNGKRFIENWLTLMNKPDDPHTFYSRTWRTISTPDLAIATDAIQGIAERGTSSQLGGNDHRPVISSIER